MKTNVEIIEILKSIKEIKIEDGIMEVRFHDSDEPWSKEEFEMDSFTRDLLDLIEHHLMW